jgi:hypothetical protein
MKRLILVFLFMTPVFASCSSDNSVLGVEQAVLAESDQAALLFMIEEEKLARDVYFTLGSAWGIQAFSNIQSSEQQHMNAVAQLLNQYEIPYALAGVGEFGYDELSSLYETLVETGLESSINALEVGALIEDLDIVDLQEFINETENSSITRVFSNLQCGSRNHIRSFTRLLGAEGVEYTPQYLSNDEYQTIISGTTEQCGQQ